MTEDELLANLDEDLREAYQTFRERASGFGEQRIYNNARAVMFSCRVCYAFVRPKKSFLELCFFLPRIENDLSLKSVLQVSKAKFAHVFKVVHSDQIEEPLTDWLLEEFVAAE